MSSKLQLGVCYLNQQRRHLVNAYEVKTQTWWKILAAYSRGWLKKSPAGWLPVHRDQLRAQRSVTSMGELYHLTVAIMTLMYILLVVFTLQKVRSERQFGRRWWHHQRHCRNIRQTDLPQNANKPRSCRGSNLEARQHSHRTTQSWDKLVSWRKVCSQWPNTQDCYQPRRC